jgi:hypothetical protein
MDIPRIFNITESAHRIHNPLTPEKLATLGTALRLDPGVRVLDLGSGSEKMLCTWARDHGVAGTGIDMSQLYTEQAKSRAVKINGVISRFLLPFHQRRHFASQNVVHLKTNFTDNRQLITDHCLRIERIRIIAKRKSPRQSLRNALDADRLSFVREILYPRKHPLPILEQRFVTAGKSRKLEMSVPRILQKLIGRLVNANEPVLITADKIHGHIFQVARNS